MEPIASYILRFPLIVFTVLLSLLAVYWLLVALRLAPIELFERDSLKEDHLASTMVSLGFAGVPVSVALTLLIVPAALLTLVVELGVLRWLSLGIYRVPIGFLVLWAALALASPLAARLCRGLHCRFHRHPELSRRCLLGERVRVIADTDSEEGIVMALLDGDETRQVRLHDKSSNRPRAGERRVLVKYLAEIDGYRSVLEQDFLDARTRLARLHLLGPGRHRHGESDRYSA